MDPPVPAAAAPGPPRLTARRCARHPEREAAARCPSCGGDFCRECVSEHHGRLLCADCLAKEARAAAALASGSGTAKRVLMAALAAAGLWGAVFLLGEGLVQIPSESHATTFWQDPDAEGSP